MLGMAAKDTITERQMRILESITNSPTTSVVAVYFCVQGLFRLVLAVWTSELVGDGRIDARVIPVQIGSRRFCPTLDFQQHIRQREFVNSSLKTRQDRHDDAAMLCGFLLRGEHFVRSICSSDRLAGAPQKQIICRSCLPTLAED